MRYKQLTLIIACLTNFFVTSCYQGDREDDSSLDNTASIISPNDSRVPIVLTVSDFYYGAITRGIGAFEDSSKTTANNIVGNNENMESKNTGTQTALKEAGTDKPILFYDDNNQDFKSQFFAGFRFEIGLEGPKETSSTMTSAHILLPLGGGEFLAGTSYKTIITIDGLEEITMKATPQPWIDASSTIEI